MRRRTTAEQNSDLPRGANDDDLDGAGCLVALGVAGLLLLLLVMWVITASNLQSAMNALDWTGLPEFFQSVWSWIRRGSPATRVTSLISIFAIGYCVLLWQWIVFVLGRRTILSPIRLWVVSSVFFIVVIAAIAGGLYSTRDGSKEWLFMTIVCCSIPSLFLLLTLPLWMLRTRPVNEPSRPRKSPGARAGTG